MTFGATIIIGDDKGTQLYQTFIVLNPRGYYWKKPEDIFNGKFLELRLVEKASRGSTGKLEPVPSSVNLAAAVPANSSSAKSGTKKSRRGSAKGRGRAK